MNRNFIKYCILLCLLTISFTLGVLTCKCNNSIEVSIEDVIQKEYYIDCLRLNKINFAIQDNGDIILFNKSMSEIRLIDEQSYQAFKYNNLQLCTPEK